MLAIFCDAGEIKSSPMAQLAVVHNDFNELLSIVSCNEPLSAAGGGVTPSSVRLLTVKLLIPLLTAVFTVMVLVEVGGIFAQSQ